MIELSAKKNTQKSTFIPTTEMQTDRTNNIKRNMGSYKEYMIRT